MSIFLLFTLFSINSNSHLAEADLTLNRNQNHRLLISLAIIAFILFVGFKSQPIIAAESKFKDANLALIANDGKKTYDLLQQAINLNPYEDRYHASFAQVNLAIARAIAANAKDPKNLTDDQKNTILQLIQQAIKEGQNTVSLNPTRAANWQVLANIYQVVIPYAKQADQYAIDSYNQTINLDPTDPNLRIALGGLYYSLGQYDNAINSYQFAVLAKPDLANAYYNLAAGYTAKNDFDNAIAAMNKVISLVPKDTADAKQAQSDLETLQKKQDAFKNSTGSANLTAPQKQSAPAISPQLTLPKEATPPAAIQPTTEGGLPLPSNSPTPAVSPTSTPAK